MELISPTEFARDIVQALQEYSVLAAQSVANLFRYPRYMADMIQQADLIGVGSLPIVVLTGFFTGAVLALNSASTLQRFGSLTLIGQLVSVGMVRELGPVLTGLMVAGRNASGMASELGSMIVTEQIDAMRALGTPLPPMVSTTTSTSGADTTSVHDAQARAPAGINSAGIGVRRHTTETASRTPLRSSMRSALAASNCAVACPTVPNPTIPTLTSFTHPPRPWPVPAVGSGKYPASPSS